jgi:hypothetical protein
MTSGETERIGRRIGTGPPPSASDGASKATGRESLTQTRAFAKNTGLPRIRINASEKIPQELRKLYGYLSGALVEAHESFLALEKLYMNKDVVALMNSTAPEFFVLLQELLTHNIFLCIARLTDKPEVACRNAFFM